MDGGAATECEALGEVRLLEDVAQRATDDEILFDLARVRPWRRRGPLLDIGGGNHASISSGTFRLSFQAGASGTLAAREARHERTDGSSGLNDFAFTGERTQADRLTSVSEVLEQIAEAPRGGVLVEGGGAGELPGISLRAEVMDDLCRAIETGSLMEVANDVEQEELDARHLGESCVGLQLAEPRRLVDRSEGLRRLIHELDPLSINRDGPKLLRDDHLEDLRGLMRSAVKRGGAEQRDPVVQAEMMHERIDPARRVWSAGGTVFRPQDEVEAVLRTSRGDAAGSDVPRQRRTRSLRGPEPSWLRPWSDIPAPGRAARRDSHPRSSSCPKYIQKIEKCVYL